MSTRKHPIANLTAQLKKHRAFTWNNLSKITAYYSKLVLQEPLRVAEKLITRNEIENHELEQDPIFIIGHWRSGTSYLQYFLSQDPQFGFLNKFQVVFPDVFLKSEQFLKSILNRVPETLNLIRDARNMSINLEFDSPSEIEIALTTMISPTSIHWGHIFPQDAWTYFNKYLFFDSASPGEIRKWKRDYTYLIKKASLKTGGRPLLIKSPGNTARINQLLALYPNAKFIFIHRNPYDVFYSNKKLWNTLLDNLALQEFSQKEQEEEIIQLYDKLMSTYLNQRSLVPQAQLMEIRYEKLNNSPVQTLSMIYDQLNIDGLHRAEPFFQSFLLNKANDKPSDYEYEGQIVERLNDRWGFALREWNYPLGNFDKMVRTTSI